MSARGREGSRVGSRTPNMASVMYSSTPNTCCTVVLVSRLPSCSKDSWEKQRGEESVQCEVGGLPQLVRSREAYRSVVALPLQ